MSLSDFVVTLHVPTKDGEYIGLPIVDTFGAGLICYRDVKADGSNAVVIFRIALLDENGSMLDPSVRYFRSDVVARKYGRKIRDNYKTLKNMTDAIALTSRTFEEDVKVTVVNAEPLAAMF